MKFLVKGIYGAALMISAVVCHVAARTVGYNIFLIPSDNLKAQISSYDKAIDCPWVTSLGSQV